MALKSAAEISAAAHALLRRFYGYTSFRPMQLDVITAAMQGRDTLVLMPTGGGKSMCYQMPALLADGGVVIVVSPLIALMNDQVAALTANGIPAAAVHSLHSESENHAAMEALMHARVKILYISPERLMAEIDRWSASLPIALFAIDEAHCISQWGYDFRPSYLKIADLRREFPQAVMLALTASATPEVADDIRLKLQFRPGHQTFSRSFARENLSYIVRRCDFKEPMLLRVLRGTTGSAIVYTRSRKRTREIAQMLVREGIAAQFYHAGLAPEEKAERQNLWKAGGVRVMVATNAFGMGIDKPDVRVVVHYDLPSSLEEYYQEAGRAGRDGLHAFAVLLVTKADKALLTRRIAEAFPPKETIRRVYELAGNFLDVAVGEGYNRLYDFNFPLFCQRFDLKPVTARNSLLLLSRAGYIDYVDEVDTRSRVMMLMDKHELYDVRLDAASDRVLRLLLRTYTGLFADYVNISEDLLASRLEQDRESVYQSLLNLTRARVLHYIPRKTTPYIFYTTSREEPRYVNMPLEVYEHQRQRLEQRIEAMKRFAFSDADGGCRVSAMLRYFGEQPGGDCGKCDVCRSRRSGGSSRNAGSVPLRQTIEYLASQPGGRSVEHIAAHASASVNEVVDQVRQLADEGVVKLTGMTVEIVTKR